MNVIKHKDGAITLYLKPGDAKALWGLVREGRRAHVKQDTNYNSDFALHLLQKLPSDPEHVKRFP